MSFMDLGSLAIGAPPAFIGGSPAGQQGMIEELVKAMTVGAPPPGVGGGTMQALTIESLDTMMTYLTHRPSHLKLLKRFVRANAISITHQFTQLTGHGHALNPFIPEGGLPAVVSDSSWVRQDRRLKIAAERAEVSDVANVVTLQGGVTAPMVAEESQRKLQSILSKMEWECFFGDDTVNPLSFNGLANQVAAANVQDLRGKNLTTDAIGEATVNILNSAGPLPQACFMSFGAHNALGLMGGSHLILDRDDNSRGGDSTLAVHAKGQKTVAGNVPYEGSYFLQPTFVQPGAIGPATSRPVQPLLTSAVAAPSATSRFVAIDAGNYRYEIAAVGLSGRSTTLAVAPVAVAMGDGVTFTLNDAAIADVVFYEVWRSDLNGAVATNKFMVKVPFTGGPTVFIDDNDDIPGTSHAFLVNFNLDITEYATLGVGPVRVDIAKTALSHQFCIVMVGGLIVKAPSQLWVFKNCADTYVP